MTNIDMTATFKYTSEINIVKLQQNTIIWLKNSFGFRYIIILRFK